MMDQLKVHFDKPDRTTPTISGIAAKKDGDPVEATADPLR